MFKYFFFILIQCLCTVTSITITPISPQIFNYAYNPYWDQKEQSLYFVDFLGQSQQFYRYDYAQNQVYGAALDTGRISLTFAVPLAGNKNELAVGNDKQIVVINWDGVSPTATLARNQTPIGDPNYSYNHLDFAGIDPKGRLATGTYRTIGCVQTPPANNTAYLIELNGEIVPLIQNVDTVAGFAWNRKKKLFYYFDSCNYIIYEYKWSPKTGMIRDPRPVFAFPPTQTYVMIGMDISCEGNLFVGLYMASQIVEINPRTGKVENVIHMPVETINAVTFGGPKMDTLFVTTSALIYFNYFKDDAAVGVPLNNPMGGQVFMVKGLGTKGCPKKRIKSPL